MKHARKGKRAGHIIHLNLAPKISGQTKYLVLRVASKSLLETYMQLATISTVAVHEEF